MQKIKNQARQGDVYLKKAVIPAEAKLFNGPGAVRGLESSFVLAEGEATGHAHEIVGDVELYERDGVLYCKVMNGGAKLTHQEHGQQTYAPGTYKVVKQHTWSAGVARRVVD